MARRTQGTGTLTERNGYWSGQWRVNGKLVRRSLGKVRAKRGGEGLSRTEAEAKLQELIAEARRSGMATRQGGEQTIEMVWEAYRADRGKALKEATTLVDYASCVRVHIVPFFGTTPVRHITRERCRDFIAHLVSLGLSAKTVNNYGTINATLFNYAASERWIAEAPTRGVTLPRPEKKGLVFLEPHEVEALIAYAQDGELQAIDRAMYAVAAYAGLRFGELLALRHQDIDYASSVIRVERSIARGREGTPKSHEIRSVPMAPQAAEALKALGRRSLSPLVFANPATGEPVARTRFMERYEKALAGARLPVGFRFHDLRHTFGTTLARAGVDVTRIQAWMGHSDLKTTQRYLHYAPSGDDAARIAAAFGRGPAAARRNPRK